MTPATTAAPGAIRPDAAHPDRLPAEERVPGHDRGADGQGIVHIGVGNCHRAHRAATR